MSEYAAHRLPVYCSFLALCAAYSASACGPLDLGSNVVWSSDAESGGFSDWQAKPGGGAYALSTSSRVAISMAHAHAGRRSIELTAPANGTDDGAEVWRALPTSGQAYYSAWFFIPSRVKTETYWTIEQFRSRPVNEAGAAVSGINVNLRSIPDGSLVMYVLQNETAYLAAPLADPPPIVPVGRWFQVEALVRFARDSSGRFVLWLDGREVYDLDNRSTAGADQLFWVVCNITRSTTPSPLTIYVDDAAMSRQRVTPSGVLSISE